MDQYRNERGHIYESEGSWVGHHIKQSLSGLPGPEEELLRQEQAERIERVLTTINQRSVNISYSDVLLMKYYEGLAIAEIAQVFGVSYKTIESLLSRAREAFVSEWEKMELKVVEKAA